MRQIALSIMLMFVALTATAQDKKGEALNEKFFDARVGELVYRLDMTEEQKTKFTPIYRRYTEEMLSVMGPHKKGDWKKKGDKKLGDKKQGEKKVGNDKDGETRQQRKQLTEEEKLNRMKLRMEKQKQAQDIRLKYLDEFSKILTAKQVNKLYEVENKMQKKLKDRRQHPQGNKKRQQKVRKQKKD